MLALVAGLALMIPAGASASGPKLTVSQADLEAAFRCPIDPTNATKTPVMFVTGTGATGDQGYLIGQSAFEHYGHPVCYMNFPDFTTADIQVSVEYLVYGLRREYKMAGRKVAVIGISQGGLLPRFALTYWPDLRKKVSDVVAAAGTQHGTSLLAAARPHTVHSGELAAGTSLQPAQGDQRPARRESWRRVVHDGPLAHR